MLSQINKNAIIIFDIYLNNIFKIKIFEKTLASVKKLKLPIMVISNFDVPQYLRDQFDHFLYRDENLLFTDSYDKYIKSHISFEYQSSFQSFKFEKHFELKQKHGLSVMSNINRCTTLAQRLGYKKYIRIEWDFILHDNDISKVANIIENFVRQNENYFFVYDKYIEDLIFYHFWMVDLKFWNDNFPHFLNESDYKKFILQQTNQNNFLEAEKILHLAFRDKIDKTKCIAEIDFINLLKDSRINVVVNDLNFDLPSSNGVCRGLANIIIDNKITNDVCLFTWNRMSLEKDIKNYVISNNYKEVRIDHSVECFSWFYNILPFNIKNTPITLVMDNKFTRIYNSITDIDSFLIFEKSPKFI